jgi:lysyl-tRNA synthetase class II
MGKDEQRQAYSTLSHGQRDVIRHTERFELMVCGHRIKRPIDQRERFEEQMRLKRR